MSIRKPHTGTPSSNADQSRNEYIPSFISKKPFYIDDSTTDADYLEHQRLQSQPKDTLDKAKWYERGKKLGPAATKFRKGACENCGAMTHKTKECLGRPRKQGAKWTGRDIQADEVVDKVSLGWDAKRDRWNGYDAREYEAVVQEYQELEELKNAAAKSKTQDDSDAQGNGADEQTPKGEEGARYAEETDMGRSQPTSTRQLRLREDTAKYLLNLDLESARYDPKTRSMDTSTQNLEQNAGDSVAEEGFVRPAGNDDDATEFERAQRYAWETQENQKQGQAKLHLQANPTEGEFLRKKKDTEDAEKKASRQKALLDKYGGAEYIQAISSATSTDNNDLKSTDSRRKLPTMISASERYVEYDSSGRIKGSANEKKSIAKSKYAEDVLTNNHTSVWGSWWNDFKWGYACCHSTVKNSYCTGEEGKRAFEEAEGMRTGDVLLLEDNPDQSLEDNGFQDTKQQQQKLSLEQDGEDIQTRKNELEAVDTTSIPPNSERRGEDKGDDQQRRFAKKRTLQEIQSGVTEEELESYKRNRMAADDPMREMLGRNDLLEPS